MPENLRTNPIGTSSEVERTITTIGESFNDGSHIIFINGEYSKEDDNSDLAKLIHDFSCKNADDMYLEELAERTRYYKESSEGVSHMCKIIEDMLNENAKNERIQMAKKLLTLKLGTEKEIANITELTIQEVQELANQLKNVSI